MRIPRGAPAWRGKAKVKWAGMKCSQKPQQQPLEEELWLKEDVPGLLLATERKQEGLQNISLPISPWGLFPTYLPGGPWFWLRADTAEPWLPPHPHGKENHHLCLGVT